MIHSIVSVKSVLNLEAKIWLHYNAIGLHYSTRTIGTTNEILTLRYSLPSLAWILCRH